MLQRAGRLHLLATLRAATLLLSFTSCQAAVRGDAGADFTYLCILRAASWRLVVDADDLLPFPPSMLHNTPVA